MPNASSQLSGLRVATSLQALAKKRPITGNNKEETSALFYFFAGAATARECRLSFGVGIDLSTKTSKSHLDTFLRFFRIFSQVGGEVGGEYKLITKLGCISSSAKSADSAARSNFLSTIVERASKGAKDGSEYPSRPRGGQVMIAGSSIVGSRKTIRLHPRWQSGLAILMAGRESKTPWTDLCIVLFRAYPVNGTSTGLTSFLVEKVTNLLDPEISGFLVKALKAEGKCMRDAPWASAETGTDPLLSTDVAQRAGGSMLEQAQLRITRLEDFILSKGFDPTAVK